MKPIRYIEWFAGVGGFRLGMDKHGFECVGACEINPHARKVYEARYGTPQWFPKDIREVRAEDIPDADLWVGGSPCTGFSVAGLREGLENQQSGLLRHWLRLAGARRPEWFWLENVPGILSGCSCPQCGAAGITIPGHGGRDFGEIIAAVDDIGYMGAWRCLDAQFFGVPQRRRRVFAIGSLGGSTGPESVLFEPESGKRNHTQSKKNASENCPSRCERRWSRSRTANGSDATEQRWARVSIGCRERGWRSSCSVQYNRTRPVKLSPCI